MLQCLFQGDWFLVRFLRPHNQDQCSIFITLTSQIIDRIKSDLLRNRSEIRKGLRYPEMFEGLVNGYFKDFTAYPFSLEETDDRAPQVRRNKTGR